MSPTAPIAVASPVVPAWSLRGERVAFASARSLVQVLNSAGERMETFSVQGVITALAFSSDGTLLAVGNDKGIVQIWQRGAGQGSRTESWRLATTGHYPGADEPLRKLAFSPGDPALLAAAVGTKIVWLRILSDEIEQRELEPRVSFFDKASLVHAEFDLGGRWLVIATEAATRVVDVQTGKIAAEHAVDSGVRRMAISREGQVALLARSKLRVLSLDRDSGTLSSQSVFTVPFITPRDFADISFMEDGRVLVLGASPKRLEWTVFDLAAKRIIPSSHLPVPAAGIFKACLLPHSGDIVAASRSGLVRVYSQLGEVRGEWKTAERSLEAIFALRNGVIITAAGNGSVARWRDHGAKLGLGHSIGDKAELQGALAEGAIIVAALPDGRLELQDTESGEVLYRLEAGAPRPGSIIVADHENGGLLLTQDAKGEVVVWAMNAALQQAARRMAAESRVL